MGYLAQMPVIFRIRRFLLHLIFPFRQTFDAFLQIRERTRNFMAPVKEGRLNIGKYAAQVKGVFYVSATPGL